MRISDWGSDVCSSDLGPVRDDRTTRHRTAAALLRAQGPGRRGARAAALAARKPHRPVAVRARETLARSPATAPARLADRKSVVEGKSVSVRVDSGCCRCLKKNTHNK